MAIRQVEIIVGHSPTGKMTPLRFQIDGRAINVGRILSMEEQKSVGSVFIVYDVESVVDDRLHRYQLKFDKKASKWYFVGGN